MATTKQCSGSISFPSFFLNSPSCQYNIQVTIDGVPITNSILISPSDTPLQIQNSLNTNRINNITGSFSVSQSGNDLVIILNNIVLTTTALAFMNIISILVTTQLLNLLNINCGPGQNFFPGDNILGDNGATGVVVSFIGTILSLTNTTGNWSAANSLTDLNSGCTANISGILPACTNFIFQPVPLTCQIIIKRRNNAGAGISVICFSPKQFDNEICPELISYLGRIYERIGYNEKGQCCYRQKK